MALAAGGHGGIQFDHQNGWLDKPTNEVEVGFLSQIHGGQGPVVGVPYPVSVQYLPLAPFMPTYYGCQIGGNGGWTIRIGNLKHGLGDGAKEIDIKIGARTVSKNELISSGKNSAAAFFKSTKLGFADWLTGSSERGFRIVQYTGQPTYLAFARTRVATDDPKPILETVLSSPMLRTEARTKLRALIHAVENTNYFFIASSVLFCASPGAPLRMKLIDFAHSYTNGAGHTNARKYNTDFRNGIQSLINHIP